MSVDSTTLERSALERKARDELAVIAQHLGVRTRSRDRKAEIVQAILEKTGVESMPQPVEPAGSVDDQASKSPRRPNGAEAGGGAPAEETEHSSDNGGQGGALVSEPESDQSNEASTAAQESPGAPAPPEGQLSLHAASSPSGASGQDETNGGDRKDKVVDLTNHETQPFDDSRGPDAGAPEASPSVDAPSGGEPSTETKAQESQAAEDRQPEAASSETSPASAEAASPEQSHSSDQTQRNGADQGVAQKTDGQRTEGQKQGQPGGQRQGGGGQRSQDRADQRGQRNGQKGGGQQQDPDSGNRRRRRRGRNRGGSEGVPEEYTGEPLDVEGYLDLRDEGYGFLRIRGARPSKDDIYVSVKQARQFGLRKGDHVKGGSRPALRNEKNPALLRIDQVNGSDPEEARKRRKFEDLTPLFPDEKLSLEAADDPGNMTSRIIDLISPIGKGQRGLIVSPPKAGKTTIMKQIVRSIEINNPEVKLMVLLVDERPEEVTDMRRWLRNPTSEVAASTFDRPADEHAHVAELAIERAKRLVEQGEDVCVVLDGITRLARAYNLAAPATGRIMSGGVDSGALYPPKKFFGAARNVEEGGSLTILATALIETGSKMDEVIFEEFKGTGNMELRLDRRLAERRIYPAIDVDASSTRHEELLFQRNQLNLVWALRRVLSGLSSSDGGNAASLELLIDRMKTFRTNDEFLAEVAKNRLAAG